MVSPIDRIAIVSDEVSPTFEAAVMACLPLGIRRFEIRNLDGSRVPEISVEQRRRVAWMARDEGLDIIGISPGIGRVTPDSAAAKRQLTEVLPRAVDLARAWGATRLTVFGYLREGTGRESDALQRLAQAAEQCAAAGLTMAIENVGGTFADTAPALLHMASAAGASLIWDPANAVKIGDRDTTPDPTWPPVVAVHVKDWTPRRGWVRIGEGRVGWPRQVDALSRLGYTGVYCLENHRPTDPDATRINLARMMSYLEHPQSHHPQRSER